MKRYLAFVTIGLCAACFSTAAFAERMSLPQKISPQNPPQSLRGMSATQFRTLPDSTPLELRGKTMTKGELVKQMNAARTGALAKARSVSPKTASLLQRKNEELLQKHQQRIASANAQVRARMAAVPKGIKRTSAQSPSITGVYGTVTPYGLVQITGSNFGETPGNIRLRGTFPKDGGVVTLAVDQWFGDAVSGKVPMVNGAFDQSATLEVTLPGGGTAQQTVSFKPAITLNVLPASMFTGKACSTQASFHNECTTSGASPGVVNFVSGMHQDLVGADPMSTGVDTFTFGNLPAGYELDVSEYFDGPQASICTATGKTISCSWKHSGAAPVSAGDYATSYKFITWAVGPAGGLDSAP